MAAPADQPRIELVHGHRIPSVGLGTWPHLGQECEDMVAEAIGFGYRLVDTAFKYGNEEAVGRGIARSAVPRSELFVTSKFNKESHSVDGVKRAYEASLRKLGLEYLDLFLVHWPVPAHGQYVEAWKGLVTLLEEGAVKAIGVSNFKPAHLDRIIDATGVVPDVNQIQLSVDLARLGPRAVHSAHGIVTQSWSPLGRGSALLADPYVVGLAERYGKSPAQILLRWHVDQGIVPVPRADTSAQLAQNVALFDFELASEELERLGAFDAGEAAARDSDDPANGH
ncbi:aldo/keto reductase [Sinomonas soli]